MPAEHVPVVVVFTVLRNFPAATLIWHWDAAVLLLAVFAVYPDGQFVHPVAPTPEYVAPVQAEQLDAAVPPVVLRKVPAAQFAAAAVPPVQYLPAGQIVHAVPFA